MRHEEHDDHFTGPDDGHLDPHRLRRRGPGDPEQPQRQQRGEQQPGRERQPAPPPGEHGLARRNVAHLHANGHEQAQGVHPGSERTPPDGARRQQDLAVRPRPPTILGLGAHRHEAERRLHGDGDRGEHRTPPLYRAPAGAGYGADLRFDRRENHEGSRKRDPQDPAGESLRGLPNELPTDGVITQLPPREPGAVVRPAHPDRGARLRGFPPELRGHHAPGPLASTLPYPPPSTPFIPDLSSVE